MTKQTTDTPQKELSKLKKLFKNKYFNVILYSVLNLLFIIWSHEWWMILLFVVIIDGYITKKVNWTFWKKRGKPKTKAVEWIDAIVWAGIAAFIIRSFFIEAYKIPTSSMEKTLRVGDYLFVSKYTYGPRLPMTILAVPFVHHTLPLTHHTPAFVNWWERSYKRIKGLTNIKRNDIVVFNFPVGDTVVANFQATSYYELCRQFGKENVLKDEVTNPYTGMKQTGVFGPILYRPIDKRDNYVKRCIAIAGDTLQYIDGQAYINGVAQIHFPQMQHKFVIITDGTILSKRYLQKLDISFEDLDASKEFDPNLLIYSPEIKKFNTDNIYILPLTQKNYEILKANPNIVYIKQLNKFKNYKETSIYPNTPQKLSIDDSLISFVQTINPAFAEKFIINKGKVFSNFNDFLQLCLTILPDTIFLSNAQKILTIAQKDIFPWNEDNFGPILIPRKGQTIELTIQNLPLYERMITVYENNELKVEGNSIFINNKPTTSYTFQQDYYFMSGDNRNNSFDSRYWGLVPDDHIVGTPLFIWLSTDKDKGFGANIRLKRLFMGTRKL